MSIAQRLILARGEIPRTEVAKAIGVSVSAISMYENGDRVPKDSVKIKLAEYYHTTVQELFLVMNVTICDIMFDYQSASHEHGIPSPGGPGWLNVQAI